MKINKIRKKKSNIYELLFSDLTKLDLYDDTLIKYNLLTKKEIDNTELKDITSYNNYLDAYYNSIKFITTKLRTKLEIEKKLTSLGYTKDVINTTIDRLVKEKYINDDVYIKCYINDQINLSLKGPNKIRNELIKLKLPLNIIDNYLSTFDNDIWQERIKKIIDKKKKANHNMSNSLFKNKVTKDIINLGYPSNLVKSITDSIIIDNELDILRKEFEKEKRKLSRKYEGNELNKRIKYNLYKKGFNLEYIESLL